VRCARHCSRPTHAGQLQLDLWWRGENIAAQNSLDHMNRVLPFLGPTGQKEQGGILVTKKALAAKAGTMDIAARV
jgi:hypothetical protein